MVISYKNRFSKIFTATIICLLVVILVAVWQVRGAYKMAQGQGGNLASTQVILFVLLPLLILFEVLYLYSHYLLAKAKGYSGWFTLLGLLSSFIGLIILALLPDKRKNG